MNIFSKTVLVLIFWDSQKILEGFNWQLKGIEIWGVHMFQKWRIRHFCFFSIYVPTRFCGKNFGFQLEYQNPQRFDSCLNFWGSSEVVGKLFSFNWRQKVELFGYRTSSGCLPQAPPGYNGEFDTQHFVSWIVDRIALMAVRNTDCKASYFIIHWMIHLVRRVEC